MANTVNLLTESVGEVLSKLDALVQLTSGTSAFVNALGWELPPGVDDIGLAALDFTDLLQKLKVVADSSSEERKDEILMASRIAELGLAIGATVDSIRELADSLEALFGGFGDYLDRTSIHKELPRRLLDLLLIKQLSDRSPLAAAVLTFLNLIEFKYFAADPATFQIEHVRAIVHYDHLKSFLDDPAQHLATTYGWGTPEFVDILLLERLGQVLRQLGLTIQNFAMDPRAEEALVGPPPTDPGALPAPQMNVTIHEQIGEVVGLKLGLSAFGVRPTGPGASDGGIGFLPLIRGEAEGSIPFPGFDDAFIDLSVKGDLLKRVALIIRAGQDLTVRHGGGLSEAVTGRFALALRHGSPASDPKTLLSFPGGVGIQAEQVYLQAGVEKFSDRPAESFAEFGMLGGRVSFSMDAADSFLSEAVAKKKVEAPFDLRVGWNRDGVYFHGSSGLSVSLPAHIEAGPFTVDSVTLGLGVKDAGLAIESSVSGHLTLGPLVATVQRIGLDVRVSFESGNIGIFDLSPHFKPPEGLGLSVEGGGFTGGGFLGFEPEAGRYSGMLELGFQGQFTLKAFGLLETRQPNGEPGFSLVIVISSEFTPIPLGFGFSLTGVGGLLGLNRTVQVDRLASGLGDQTLQSVLFPTNLVANADRILSDLRQVFPPARGRFVFGPLAKITWGTPALLTAEVGLVLEVPEPVRLVLLGVVRGILPDEQAAILRLEVHFLGVIDVAQARLSFDATLVDSRLLAFTLTGDLALRLYWGADANFLVTVGGFHPAYQPPPLALPALHRLTVALAAGDNPRLTLETYLAVTANTAQFGARLELYAAAWKFNAYGFLSFDVLFQFNPFYFLADVTAMLALRVGSSAIASIKLTLTLEGPTPWKAKGDARLKLCWFLTVKIRFSKTFGEARQTTLPDVAVLPRLTAALAARDTWREELPANGQRLESLRALGVDGSAPVRVHPVGTVAISQTVVPLGIALDRIGAQRPADGPAFAIADVAVGGDPQGTPPATEEQFAPAQYFDLSDADKLASPSFKRFASGVRVGDAERWRTGYAAAREVRYERTYIDSQRDQRLGQPGPRGLFPVDAGAFNTWTLRGATAKSALSFARRRKSTLAPAEVGVFQEPFAIVRSESLALFDSESLMGTEQAALQRRDALIASNPALRDALQVVPVFEMSA